MRRAVRRSRKDRRRSRPAVAGGLLAFAAVACAVSAAPAGAAKTHPAVIAHRGDRAAAPENTLPAFGSAIRKGAAYIELDTWMSKDGYPVVLHDETLDRTTKCSGRVESKTVYQLHRCDAGSWFAAAFRGEKVPTLWEAVSYIHQHSSSTKLIIHMKYTPTPSQARAVMRRVTGNAMTGRTVLMGQNPTTIDRMRAAGATRTAYIFSTAGGWSYHSAIMVPYDTAITAGQIAAMHRRGSTVWAVQGQPQSLTSLLGLPVSANLDGIFVNDLNRAITLGLL